MLNVSSGAILASMDFCWPACGANEDCPAGTYCSMTDPTSTISNRVCTPCPKAGQSCPRELSTFSSDCSSACPQDTEEVGVDSPMQSQDVPSVPRPSPDWRALSYFYYCDTPSNFTYEDVESFDACKLLCETTDGCKGVNIGYEVDSGALLCRMAGQQCADSHLGKYAGWLMSAFELGAADAEASLSVEDLEARYLQAHAAVPCDHDAPRAVLFLSVGARCPECVAVEIKAQLADHDGAAADAGAQRRTTNGSSCVLPFSRNGKDFRDCEWSGDDRAGFRDTVEGQSRWMCPVTSDYDPDAVEIDPRWISVDTLDVGAYREADAFCRNLGTHLVHIRSEEEHLRMYDHLQRHPFAYQADFNGYVTWLGITAPNLTTLGPDSASWDDDGSKVFSGYYAFDPDYWPSYENACGIYYARAPEATQWVFLSCLDTDPSALTCEAPPQRTQLTFVSRVPRLQH
ncbi:hypothetical protein CYMTET_34849, partial [Cymbomonas tetramitiformis]